MCDIQNYLRQVLGTKAGACAPPYVRTVSWGFTTAVCQKHYDLTVKFFETSGTALSQILDDTGSIRHGMAHAPVHVYNAQYLEDYVKLFVLMQTKAAVMECMQKLAAELTRTIQQQKKHRDDLDDRFHTVKKQGRGYVRISRALSYYEQLCFFPSNHVVFSGALTAQNFLWSLRQGFMPKDPGAGYSHGDFSHRLQWHAVMRVVTGNFSFPRFGGWQKTPLDLFTSLGAGAAQARGLWGAIFDAQGRSNYSDPANLLSDLKAAANLGPLSARLEASFSKRKDVERACEVVLVETIRILVPAMVKPYISSLQLTPVRLTGLTPPIAANVANLVYHWKKLGGAAAPAGFDPGIHPPLPGSNPDGSYIHHPVGHANRGLWQTYFDNVVQLAAHRFWTQYINDHRSDVGSFLRGSRGTSYINETNGLNAVDGVIVSNDGDRLVALNIDHRVTASYGGFSLYVSYSPTFGCTKN